VTRLVCQILGRHHLVSLLVRRIDGSVVQVTRCASCGAAR
jgi:hypothetical protein